MLLQGQCVQTLGSSQHSRQTGCLIGWALTMMSSLHVIRALTNSLGDTLEETQLNWGAEWVRHTEIKKKQTVERKDMWQWILTGTTWTVTFLLCMGDRKQDSYLWRFVLLFFVWLVSHVLWDVPAEAWTGWHEFVLWCCWRNFCSSFSVKLKVEMVTDSICI